MQKFLNAGIVLTCVLAVSASLHEAVKHAHQHVLNGGLIPDTFSLPCERAYGKLDGNPQYAAARARWQVISQELVNDDISKQCATQFNPARHAFHCNVTTNYTMAESFLDAYETSGKAVAPSVIFCGLTIASDVTINQQEYSILVSNATMLAILPSNCTTTDMRQLLVQASMACKQGNSTIDSCDISFTPGSPCAQMF
eukprot:m.472372 g.472372  ORF g.472372 m.472372 type:complete len:198 (-) comp21661_c3_seq4:471-1064(-)